MSSNKVEGCREAIKEAETLHQKLSLLKNERKNRNDSILHERAAVETKNPYLIYIRQQEDIQRQEQEHEEQGARAKRLRAGKENTSNHELDHGIDNQAADDLCEWLAALESGSSGQDTLLTRTRLDQLFSLGIETRLQVRMPSDLDFISAAEPHTSSGAELSHESRHQQHQPCKKARQAKTILALHFPHLKHYQPSLDKRVPWRLSLNPGASHPPSSLYSDRAQYGRWYAHPARWYRMYMNAKNKQSREGTQCFGGNGSSSEM